VTDDSYTPVDWDDWVMSYSTHPAANRDHFSVSHHSSRSAASLHTHSANTSYATLMKSNIRIFTGFSHSISGCHKNLILTTLVLCIDDRFALHNLELVVWHQISLTFLDIGQCTIWYNRRFDMCKGPFTLRAIDTHPSFY